VTDVVEVTRPLAATSDGSLQMVSAVSSSAAESSPPGGNRRLRLILLSLDVVTAMLVWQGVLSLHMANNWAEVGGFVPTALTLSAVTFALIWSQRLYQSRVCAVRSTELNRLFRVAVGVAVLASGWHKYVSAGAVTPATATVGAAVLFAALASERAMYSAWLRLRRARGDFARPVCVIGANEEAEALVHLLNDHPEVGYHVVAVVGEKWAAGSHLAGVQVVPGGDDLVEAVMRIGVTGVLIATTALSDVDRDRLLTRLMAKGIHVQISSGLTRFGSHRFRMLALAHHPTFYVEPPRLSAGRSAAKRALDLAISAGGLVAAVPVLLMSALAIKIDDKGPVFYRQDRVGQNGRVFKLLKLRTMVPDATERVAELAQLNERQGPLFKLTSDPRVTRVGRFLRMSSIDEIPQLLNVLRGQMSIVGPRPALPTEYAQFDADLADRTLVPPGITGLWQVEARDNPSFRAYRRLDLFYVENWSIAFDLAIMVGTARMLLGRTARALWVSLAPSPSKKKRPRGDSVAKVAAPRRLIEVTAED
jgi:exopolysaccharide biosynthesis polyprenyl glycosylphosphotransferase